MATALTETGLSVGTPYYMSPEQATGDQRVGPASDTYGFACGLHEMLVGDPPYIGSTAQAVLGKIIQSLPVSATSVRQSIPANVDAALRKALKKLPADRFTGADRFAKALTDPGFRHGEELTTTGIGQRGYWRRLALLFAATTAVLWAVSLGPSDADSPIARFQLTLGENGVLGRSNTGIDLAISPDSSRIAYRGPTPGTTDGSGSNIGSGTATGGTSVVLGDIYEDHYISAGAHFVPWPELAQHTLEWLARYLGPAR